MTKPNKDSKLAIDTSDNGIQDIDEPFSLIDETGEDELDITPPPQNIKPYQENFIEEKSSKAKIAESQESTRGKLAVAIVSIYGATILFCFAVIGFGIPEGERKEVL